MNRSLNISMSAASVEALKSQNYALYAFQAVRYGPQLSQSLTAPGFGGGYPLVWRRSTAYMANTPIEWDDSPAAYISATPLGDNVQVTVGDSRPVALRQIIEARDGGLGEPAANGNPGVISIISAAAETLTCGLATAAGEGSVAPTCAFPLHPGEMAMIAPNQQLLVMFAIDGPKERMAITRAYGEGLLIDFGEEDKRTVSFDINTRWNENNFTWCSKIPANVDISNILIRPAGSP